MESDQFLTIPPPTVAQPVVQVRSGSLKSLG